MSVDQLVARYLQAQGYDRSLAAFLDETGQDAVPHDVAAPDLRDVVESFLASRLQALVIPASPLEDQLEQLKLTARLPTQVTRTLKHSTNVLSVKLARFPKRSWNSSLGRFVA